jgi:acetyltransferase-like isoleucine patch superfamily enzyme
VKEGVTIGANATIICGNTIGRYAFIGAGSVVTKDVPDYALVYGNPGRINDLALGNVSSTACLKLSRKVMMLLTS